MKYLVINCWFIFLQSFAIQTVTYPIFIQDYNVYLYPNKGCTGSYLMKIEDSTTINIKLLSCKGEMDVKIYRNGLLQEKGKYINSLGLLKTYKTRTGYNPQKNGFTSEIFISEYYQPLRNGTWTFYKNDSVQKVVYSKGLKQN